MALLTERVTSQRNAGRGVSVALIGSSFKTADIGFRESLASRLRDEALRRRIASVPGVRESALLVTCNRVELLLAVDQGFRQEELLKAAGLSGSGAPDSRVYMMKGIDAVRHLISVASGLDSLVIGENQITEQVRRAGRAERAAGKARAVLSHLFDVASARGDEIRKIVGNGTNSMSDLAVQFVERRLGHAPREVLLVGSGKMAILALRHFVAKGSKVHVVTGRRPERLPSGISLAGYGSIGRLARRCDAIIAATSRGGHVLRKEHVNGKRRVIVDLGFPRNVDPDVGSVPGNELVDLDGLSRFGESVYGNRERVKEAEERVAEEAERFMAHLAATRSSATLPALYSMAERVRREEAERALRRIQNASPKERRVIEAMSRRLVSKLLSRPTRYVRSCAQREQAERMAMVEEVFMLD